MRSAFLAAVEKEPAGSVGSSSENRQTDGRGISDFPEALLRDSGQMPRLIGPSLQAQNNRSQQREVLGGQAAGDAMVGAGVQ